MSLKTIAILLFASICAASPPIPRDKCTPCNPKGATGSSPPEVGQEEMKSLYLDLLESVKDIHFRKRWADPMEARADGFCCRETLDCVKVDNLNIPMCYDKFTTQYAFPDSSWGSLTSGDYNDEDGSKINLLTGEYTKTGGEKGNIYSQDPGAKPNTATLSIPPQWTGTGVGSAIPATEIASITAPTSSASRVMTTNPATTGAPTATGAQNGAASTISSTGAAGHVGVNESKSVIVSIVAAFMYALYPF